MEFMLLGVAGIIIFIGLVIWLWLTAAADDNYDMNYEVLDMNADGKVNVEDAKVAVKAVKHAASGAVGGAKATVTRAKRGRKPKN